MSAPARFLLLAALVLTGCKSAEDYARNNNATAGWLEAHAGQPSINVAGQWHSDDWGDALFQQKGNRVTGILGDYPIGGVLSGRDREAIHIVASVARKFVRGAPNMVSAISTPAAIMPPRGCTRNSAPALSPQAIADDLRDASTASAPVARSHAKSGTSALSDMACCVNRRREP